MNLENIGVTAVVAFSEVILFIYLITAIVPSEKSEKKNLILFLGAVVSGMILTVCKYYSFGIYMPVLAIIVISFAYTGMAIEKEYTLLIGIPAVYYALVTFADLLTGTIFMLITSNSIREKVLYRPGAGWKSIIYIVAEMELLMLVLLFRKNVKIKRIITQYRGMVCSFGIGFDLVTWMYRGSIYELHRGYIELYFDNFLILTLCIFILMSIVWQISKLIFRYESLQRENQIIEMRDSMIEKNYQELKNALEENRILNHDIKNHLLILSEYDKNREWEKLEEYLNRITPAYQNVGVKAWTGNHTIDFLLNLKKSEALKENIAFEIDSDVVMQVPFSDDESCILICNLLDNAMEACCKINDKERWIHFELKQHKKMLFMTIENSIGEQPLKDGNKWISSKVDKKLHGYGLLSVERLIQKYEGMIEYCVESSQFKVKLSFFMS